MILARIVDPGPAISNVAFCRASRRVHLSCQGAAGGWREMHGDDAAGGMVESARNHGANTDVVLEIDEIVARGADIYFSHDPAACGVEWAGRGFTRKQFDILQAGRNGGPA